MTEQRATYDYATGKAYEHPPQGGSLADPPGQQGSPAPHHASQPVAGLAESWEPGWTPEPWIALGVTIAPESLPSFDIAECIWDDNDPLNEANAERIVACVNALAGVSDPAAELARLRRRDALVGELVRTARTVLDVAADDECGWGAVIPLLAVMETALLPLEDVTARAREEAGSGNVGVASGPGPTKADVATLIAAAREAADALAEYGPADETDLVAANLILALQPFREEAS